MSYDWDSLNVKQKIMFVTTDIMQLLDRLCEKTKPGGELDSVIESASKSFEPLGELLQINWEEEGDKSINVKTLSQFILSGHSIITPEVAQLLGSSFKPAARNAEENEGNKSLSPRSESEQSTHSNKKIDELLESRDYRRRHRDSAFEKVLFKHSPVKDLTQPGPSGLQTRKDVSTRERFLKQSLRGLSSPTSNSTSSEHTSGARQPREHSENLSRPGPSGVMASKQGAKNLGKHEGNKNSYRSSQSEQVNYDYSKRIELQTQLELSDVEAERKRVSIREKFMKRSFESLHQPGPSGSSSEEISEVSKERWAKQLSKDLSQPGPSRVSTPSKQTARSSEEREGNKRLSRSQREQTQLGLSDTQTKRKEVLGREEFPKSILRSVSQQRPSSVATSEEREPRHHSQESSRPGPGERSKGFRKHMLPKYSSVDQSAIIDSKRKKKSSDSKRTRESSSIYKSYTRYNPDEWERDSDEYEEDRGRSSTIY